MTDFDLIDLAAEHRPDAIRRRLAAAPAQNHIGDAVLGAIDGCVTTFAVVSGAWGGGFPPSAVIIFGLANLVADGLSMAVGNYQATRTRRQLVQAARRVEERHVDVIPEGEREEVRQIFAGKGLTGETLDRVVEAITADRALWVETMLKDELGLHPHTPSPATAAGVTFSAFVAIGSVPLLPFVLSDWRPADAFLISALATGAAFFAIGSVRGRLLGRATIRSGINTLLTGGAAAAAAYLIAAWLRRTFGYSP